jgi:hypothetical protein
MSGGTVLPTSGVAALLALLAMMPQATAQAVGADEAPRAAGARPPPHTALSPAQKRAIPSFRDSGPPTSH